MSWLSSFLHPDKGYKKAQEQLNNYYNQSQGYRQPFLDALSDPQSLYDKWSSGYKESDAAKQTEAMATEHGMDSASSMGLLGSTPALQAIQSGTAGIVAQDKKSYLDDLMDKYKTAAGIANNMGNTASQMGQDSAGMSFGQTNAPGEMFGALGKGGLQLLLSYLTGGMGSGGFGRGAWSTGGS